MPPVRRGVPTNLSLDVDAVQLLRELAPSQKSYGRFLSELIRAESERRCERQRLRKELHDHIELVLAE